MYGSSFTAALAVLLFGFDTAVISGTIPFITKYFQLSGAMLGWAVSSALAPAKLRGSLVSISQTMGNCKYKNRKMKKIKSLLILII